MLLEARDVTMAFGAFRAVSNASLELQEGEMIGLIGPNGAGKSTFFNCLAGDLVPTAGRVVFDGVDVTRAAPEAHARLGIGRTFQVPATFADMMAVFTKEPLSWALSAFYFLTFGGFVAFSVYLPTLLRDEFGLTMADAGFRTAGFVVLATLMRPVGGILSDRIGGARVLSGVLSGVVPFALLLMWPSMLPFTVCASTVPVRPCADTSPLTVRGTHWTPAGTSIMNCTSVSLSSVFMCPREPGAQLLGSSPRLLG